MDDGDGVRKTHIMYGANLSHKLVTRYLKDVMNAGLLECDGKFYRITDKGERFLEQYKGYEEKRNELEKHFNLLESGKETLKKMLM